MLYIAEIKDMFSLQEKQAEAIKIGAGDTLMLISAEPDTPITLEQAIWLMTHTQTKDIKLVIGNSPASLVSLGAMMAKAPQTVIIGNPLGIKDGNNASCFQDVLKGHKITYFGATKTHAKKARSLREKPAEAPAPPKPTAEDSISKAKDPSPANKKKPAPAPAVKLKEAPSTKNSTKLPLFTKLGIETTEFTKEDEDTFQKIIIEAKDYKSYQKAIFTTFRELSGPIMLRTNGKSIEELKDAVSG